MRPGARWEWASAAWPSWRRTATAAGRRRTAAHGRHAVAAVRRHVAPRAHRVHRRSLREAGAPQVAEERLPFATARAAATPVHLHHVRHAISATGPRSLHVIASRALPKPAGSPEASWPDGSRVREAAATGPAAAAIASARSPVEIAVYLPHPVAAARVPAAAIVVAFALRLPAVPAKVALGAFGALRPVPVAPLAALRAALGPVGAALPLAAAHAAAALGAVPVAAF